MKAVRLYAQVLVDVALAPQSGVDLGRVIRELSAFSATFSESEIAHRVFENPAITEEERQKGLKALTSKFDLGATSERFLAILLRRGRLNLLAEIIREVEWIEIERRGGVMGEVVSAVALEPATLAGIAEALGKRLNKPVQLKQKTDPALIAGMRVTVGGITYDGSVKGKLDKWSELN
jgi:F-type H+-transporting ATPase subunit delta